MTDHYVRVEVTQEDIDKGVPEDCEACAIARAIKRQHPALRKVEVEPTRVWAVGADYRLPRSAQEFVRAYDTGTPVKPFIFEMELNDGS